jgi:hypothetical protein
MHLNKLNAYKPSYFKQRLDHIRYGFFASLLQGKPPSGAERRRRDCEAKSLKTQLWALRKLLSQPPGSLIVFATALR